MSSQTTAASARRSNPGAVLGILSLSTFAIIVMQTMVMPSLNQLASDLGITTADASWLITANLLAAAVFTPLFGSLGDALGRKRTLLTVLALTTLGSVLVATAPGLGIALVGRVLQGTGMAVMPLAIGVVREVFPPAKVPSSVALLSALSGVGAGAGLLISGLLMKADVSGQHMFWLAAAVTAIGFLGAYTQIHLAPHVRTAFHLDVPGLLTMSLGLVSLVLGINRGPEWGWDSARVIGLFVAAVVLLTAWFFVEQKVKQPLVDMSTMKNPVVLFTNLTALILGAGMFGAFVLILQFVQTPEQMAGYGFGVDALGGAVTLLPLTLGTLVAAALVSALIKKVGPKWPLVLGTTVVAITYVVLISFHGDHIDFYIASGLMGLGLGLSLGSMPTLLNNSVPADQTSIANGVNATLRSVGGSIGTTIVTAIIAAETLPPIQLPTGDVLVLPTEDAYVTAFAVSLGISVVAIIAAMLLPYRHAEHGAASTDA
ncbi:MFS transporter [Nocardioides yefusunii]|uniref:MFS transporter n=1 Tax=Nocardioides yefusunii TaxID=2500546 RepID=A0ABW1QYV5_9ACTN|nr:MFS transporter [Nocardioides yefusunii]